MFARYEACAEQYAYQVYSTEVLRGIGKSLGIDFKQSLHDVLHPKPVDNRTPQEIADDIARRAGLKVVNKN